MTAWIVVIDLRECFSQALTLIPDDGIDWGLGRRAGDAIENAEPHKRDQVLSGIKRFAKDVADPADHAGIIPRPALQSEQPDPLWPK